MLDRQLGRSGPHHRLFDAVIDRTVGPVARRYAAYFPQPRGAALLAPLRREALSAVLARHRAAGVQLAPALATGDAAARTTLASLAERALAELRHETDRAAQRAGGTTRIAAVADAAWGRVDEAEYMDVPHLDESMRASLLAYLDHFNELLGSYDLFFDELAPTLNPDRRTRILDLAAGHGGFLRHVGAIARRRGIDLDLTVTDLHRAYLQLGRARAAAQGLDVKFVEQDALDLSNVVDAGYDVITCTQSLHHFPAGLVAVMFHEAMRAATTGVVFIDGCRSARAGAFLWALSSLRFSRAFAHDALISTRIFFAPEELELLARIGPWGDAAHCAFVAPGFCVLKAVKK